MQQDTVNWRQWLRFFESRKERGLPELAASEEYSALPPSLARSLAIFQLGESGGGAIIEQAKNSAVKGIDSDYSRAMALFVKEERRHAELLAICVRNLNGRIIRSHWAAKLFVWARRLIGLRLKVLVLLAAEVVGICYYQLLASRLPGTRLQTLLADIVNDERAHLHFHCDFLRLQTNNTVSRALFVVIWRVTTFAAAIVLLTGHRHALRDLKLEFGTVWRRWLAHSRLAERLVIGENESGEPSVMAAERVAELRDSLLQLNCQLHHG